MRREIIVLLLSILILSFGIGNLFKYQIITVDSLKSNKDLITVLKDVITILAIVLGALLSYFRFFSGRTFATKADLSFEISFIETPAKSIIHTVCVSISNKGAFTIWNPRARIALQEYSVAGSKKEKVYDIMLKPSFFGRKLDDDTLIDAGEKAYFVLHEQFDNTTWAVNYTIEVISDRGRTWQRGITVANKVQETITT